jgi:hypothetical protein
MGLFVDCGLPFRLVLRQVPQNYFPAILSNDGRLVGYPLSEMFLEACLINDILVENIDQTCYLLSNHRRHSFSCELPLALLGLLGRTCRLVRDRVNFVCLGRVGLHEFNEKNIKL